MVRAPNFRCNETREFFLLSTSNLSRKLLCLFVHQWHTAQHAPETDADMMIVDPYFHNLLKLGTDRNYLR